MPATRRGFMMAAGLTALPLRPSHADDALALLGRRLSGLLGSMASARHIAAVYLDGTDWRGAALDLDMAAVLAPAHAIVEQEALRTWLGARIRADFASGAVTDVKGWRLSRTEVGACVLALGVA